MSSTTRTRTKPPNLLEKVCPGSPAPLANFIAVAVINAFRIAAADGYKHRALETILVSTEQLELMQGGRLTDFQMRSAAAWLLAAAETDPTDPEPGIRPYWLTPDDATRGESDLVAAKAPTRH